MTLDLHCFGPTPMQTPSPMPRQWLGEERSHRNSVCRKTFLGSPRTWGWSGLEKLVTCPTWVSGPLPPFCPWGLGGSHPTNVCKCFEVFLQDVSYEQRKENTAGPGVSGVRYYPVIHVAQSGSFLPPFSQHWPTMRFPSLGFWWVKGRWGGVQGCCILKHTEQVQPGRASSCPQAPCPTSPKKRPSPGDCLLLSCKYQPCICTVGPVLVKSISMVIRPPTLNRM